MNNESRKLPRRPLSELNVIDDFLFTELMNDPRHRIELSELLISTFLGRKITVREVHTQKASGGMGTEEHGIRMDAYIEPLPNGEEKAVVYDMEMETREADKESLPRRNRYYSALLDAHLLATGMDYDSLPDLLTIVVLSYDPFSEGRMIYEAKSAIVGRPEISYADGIRRLYFYTDRELDEDLGEYGRSLKNLLRYVRNSRSENAVDDTTKRIDSFVRDTKARKEVSVEFMKRWELDKIIREEGRQEGREEGEEDLNSLYRWLLDNDRLEDLRRSTEDKAFREQLKEEMEAEAR